jgi:hypothetical protein
VATASANNHFVPPYAFHGTPSGNSPAGNAANATPGQPERNLVIGFPHVEAFQTVQPGSSSTSPDATFARSGQSLRFFGDGHQIWSEPARTSALPSTQTGFGTLASSAFRGAAGFTSASTLPITPPHIVAPPFRGRPIIIVDPGYGGFGYGYGFGAPFFFGDPFFGFGFGSVWVPCNGFGYGFQCAPYNAYYGYQSPYDSVVSVGADNGTQSQSQEIFSPYSPALPAQEENNGGPSPDEYVLYLKDGSVYVVNDYWFADGKLVYSTTAGQESVDMNRIDLQKTLDVNAKRGLVFTLRPAPPPADQNAPQTAPPAPLNDQNAPANQGAAPPAQPGPSPQP